MGDNKACFLKVTGLVPSAKHKEFEQTFRFVSNHMPVNCLQQSLSADILNPNLYYFFSLWPSRESLLAFCHSKEYDVLMGAYKVLGSLEDNVNGPLVDVKLFEVTDEAADQ